VRKTIGRSWSPLWRLMSIASTACNDLPTADAQDRPPALPNDPFDFPPSEIRLLRSRLYVKSVSFRTQTVS
jgi:hypothetical protein